MVTSKAPQRLLAIGDIHGYLDSLRQLLDRVQPTTEDQVVFLGDDVYRGPDSRGFLDELIRFGRLFPQTVFLRGNHEQMFLDALAWREIEQLQRHHDLPTRAWLTTYEELKERADHFGLSPLDLDRIWRREGGLETIVSFGGALENVQSEHRAFLNATRFFYEGHVPSENGTSPERKGFLFVHAGADVDQLPQQQNPLTLMNYRGFAEPGPTSPWTVVHGHTIRLEGPEMMPQRINLDTGIYLEGGRLTCCDVLTRQFWQVSRGSGP